MLELPCRDQKKLWPSRKIEVPVRGAEAEAKVSVIIRKEPAAAAASLRWQPTETIAELLTAQFQPGDSLDHMEFLNKP